ncbi:hypothetical protein Sjap_020309 [Stephania japonica]|uniref:HMA domain-containing protein n=1 Tax=Stephania japonica TaxID=461633 RepID=A0AAP0F350_9MAGN
MASVRKQALRFAENLTLPTFQVIVMNANMSCSHCSQRASKMVSKMNGTIDYVVDISNKQVILRGEIMENPKQKRKHNTSPFSFFLGLLKLRPTCYC